MGGVVDFFGINRHAFCRGELNIKHANPEDLTCKTYFDCAPYKNNFRICPKKKLYNSKSGKCERDYECIVEPVTLPPVTEHVTEHKRAPQKRLRFG